MTNHALYVPQRFLTIAWPVRCCLRGDNSNCQFLLRLARWLWAHPQASAREDPTLPPELDRDAAWGAAAQYIAVQPPGLEAHIDASRDEVTVHLTSRPIPMSFLRLAGITTVRVEADAHAEPETGVVEPEAP